MAMEACFQVSTFATATKACIINTRLPHFFSKEKLNLPTCKGFNKATSLSSSSSTSSSTIAPIICEGRRSRIICKAQKTTNEVIAVTDSSWSNLVIGSETPVLVEFWAPWCGPCRMIAPVIDELAKEYSGKIMCYKLNTDDCPSIATQYGIRSIPTVLVFKNGEKKESVIGAVPKSTLTATIEKYVTA